MRVNGDAQRVERAGLCRLEPDGILPAVDLRAQKAGRDARPKVGPPFGPGVTVKTSGFQPGLVKIEDVVYGRFQAKPGRKMAQRGRRFAAGRRPALNDHQRPRQLPGPPGAPILRQACPIFLSKVQTNAHALQFPAQPDWLTDLRTVCPGGRGLLWLARARRGAAKRRLRQAVKGGL